MRVLPNHRALAIEEGGAPADDIETDYQQFLLNGQTSNKDLQYAYDIYTDPYKCEVIEAFLLVKVAPEAIESTLRIPASVVAIYEKLYFDYASFLDELDVETYAQTYDQNDFGRELKVSAITLGANYLRYRFSRGQVSEVNIIESLQSMIETAYTLSASTKLNPLDSTISKEARQWMKMALTGMEAFIKIKPALEEYSDDFRIALQSIDRTTSADKKTPDLDIDEIAH